MWILKGKKKKNKEKEKKDHKHRDQIVKTLKKLKENENIVCTDVVDCVDKSWFFLCVLITLLTLSSYAVHHLEKVRTGDYLPPSFFCIAWQMNSKSRLGLEPAGIVSAAMNFSTRYHGIQCSLGKNFLEKD